MHKKNIEKIIEHKDEHQLDQLKDIMIELIDDAKVADHFKYKMYEFKLHKILYGCHLSKDVAEKWVSKMKNKNGTIGEHWSYEQTTQLLKEKDLKLNECDFYATLNMIYSDNYNAKFDLSTYVELAKDWLCDVDIEDKIVKYYYFIVC